MEIDKGVMIQQVSSLLKRCGCGDDKVARLEKIGYFEAPASERRHLAVAGGLALHSLNVVERLIELKAFEDEAKCIRVGLLHDLVKCNLYQRSDSGGFVSLGLEPFLKHEAASALIACSLGFNLESDEIMAITWHMVHYDLTDELNKSYAKALGAYSREVVLTHAADYLATLFEIQEEARHE